ncbi:MAG: malate synthase [Cognaticolwellia sp.]|jgi:malate synthase
MTKRISIANLQVAEELYNFVNQQVLPGTTLASDTFWSGFAKLIAELAPKNKDLLLKRTSLQQQITAYHQEHQAESFDFTDYKNFLTRIGYLATPVEDFTISTQNVDAELATIAGPQLVVPVMNARFALNAVNARWGSLYDALYGSDVISKENSREKTGTYNPSRGAKVVAFARDFLDQTIPLVKGSHHNAQSYQIVDRNLKIELSNGETTYLAEAELLIGFTGEHPAPNELVFKHHDLHFIVEFDQNSTIAKSDTAGVSGISMESALTTIMDCEDSVAAVDAADKVVAYQNWLGLNQGTLSETFEKSGKQQTRLMHPDKTYQKLDGTQGKLKARSLMFVRNVGHLMTNNAIIDQQNNEVPEGIMDAVITSLISSYDVNQKNTLRNSEKGSVYIVKPKMHGPEEVAFANELFDRVEDLLTLPRNSLKMGIMDEERRTSVNLKACIYQAKERVVFINTGFLDRTGDEIHTSMAAGVMARKADIKLTKWISAYEDNNVDVGLACGFSGRAQIGKGMWPIPDQMANMLATKINHVKAGANTAWVPSPTAATLHALHYHKVNVLALQQELKKRVPANVNDILTIPLAENTQWSAQEIAGELDNNSQGILGYVVRWIDHGVGCSKVPDINNVGLMEDRATLRISSQHMANWLQHHICTEEQVLASLKKMAAVVDKQNQHDAQYTAMSSNFDTSIAFQTALELVLQGHKQPNGYTEPLLHKNRLSFKAQAN